MKKLIILFFVMLLPMVASAYDAEIDGIYFNLNKTEKTAEVTNKLFGVASYSGDIVIPAEMTYNNVTYSVTSISDYAFYCCFGLTSITIPNSVVSIGQHAIANCFGLTSVTIGNSVISIGESAFVFCSSLTSLIIPNSVTSIGDAAFLGCSSLTSMTIPNSVTSIGQQTFDGCSSLTSLTIGNNVTSIGVSAFAFCSGLTSVTIPNSVTYIGNNPFRGCSGLTSIVVASGNSVFDSRNDCNAIIETNTNTLIAGCQNTVIPNNVTSIDDAAFFGCSGLISVNIPNSVTSIGNSAFQECSGLTSLTIPNSVTSIADCAFYGCSDLTSVTIPKNVVSIGSMVFFETGWYNNQSDGITYLDDWLLGYKGTKPNGVLAIKNGTRGIAGSALQYCTDLVSVIIPNSVTSIGDGAFDGCISLTSVFVKMTTPVAINSTIFTNRSKATLYVPLGSKSEYENAVCWKEFKEIIEIDMTDILEIAATPILVQNEGGSITVTGVGNGQAVSVYNLSGQQMGSATGLNGKAVVSTSMHSGEVAIVKISQKAVKVRLR